VLLGVEAREPAPARRHLEGTGPLDRGGVVTRRLPVPRGGRLAPALGVELRDGEVPELGEELAHVVEVTGDRGRPGVAAAQERPVLRVEAVPALRPARVVLPLRAAVARVGTQPAPQLLEAGVGVA